MRLSRDHHESLVAAQRLRRATPATFRGAREAFLAHWERSGRRHFRVEEEVLLPAFAGWGDAYDPLVAKTLCDHVAIRAGVARLLADECSSLVELHELGEQLARHVRMEERELFALIERAVPAADLDRLADAVEHAEDV
ncbi:MAG: hemerythrin domain-containing protein [Solirubrobacteraceae bacterium]